MRKVLQKKVAAENSNMELDIIRNNCFQRDIMHDIFCGVIVSIDQWVGMF